MIKARATTAVRAITLAMAAGAMAAGAMAAGAVPAAAQTAAPVDRYQVPATVSPEAAAVLARNYAARRMRPAPQRPVTPVDWERQAAQIEPVFAAQAKATVDRLGVAVVAATIGGVPVLRIRAAGFKPGNAAHRNTYVYMHGGGYVLFSARSQIAVPAILAADSGDEVISIDYTLAPKGNWRTVTDQVLAVWRGLLASGIKPGSVGIFGDSAGGALAASTALKMRDQHLPMPGALWLLSPWSDITATGDSYNTLADADPVLNATSLGWGADIYAAPADQKDPYVSPVYGDYAKPFPPTLIQVGTREIFLSNAVREYQAIRGGGHEAVLDVYEGMPHVFQTLQPPTPESRTAIARGLAFFRAHLSGR